MYHKILAKMKSIVLIISARLFLYLQWRACKYKATRGAQVIRLNAPDARLRPLGLLKSLQWPGGAKRHLHQSRMPIWEQGG